MASSRRSGSVAARLADLEQLVSAQQQEIARLRATPAPLAVHPALPTTAESAQLVALPEAAPRDERPTEPRRNSRRALLKLGGAAAAAGVAVVAASATELAHPGTAHAAAGTFSWSGGTPAVVADGTSGSPGIHATSDTSFGVWGESFSGTAFNGVSTSGRAVEARTVTGDAALYGLAYNGYGALLAGGKAALRLSPGVVAGPPSTLNDQAGEFNVDSTGALWYCYSSAGVTQPPFPVQYPGSWIRLSGPRAGAPGGALNYLAAPIRIFDSRGGQPAPLPGSKGALAGQSTYTIQVTGTTVGQLTVPLGATGVFGNLTVTNTQGGGDLILFPHGAPQPLTSNINYAGGQTIANSFSVGLDPTGAVDLFVHVSGTDVIIDIAGYVM